MSLRVDSQTALDNATLAAGVMLRTRLRRGRQPWPTDVTVGAVAAPVQDGGHSANHASQIVVTRIINYWARAVSPAIVERLGAKTLPEQLRRSYYRRHPRQI